MAATGPIKAPTKAEVSKQFVAHLLGEKDWSHVYEVTRAGIARRAFSAATVESFLAQAIAKEDARPFVREMLVSRRSWKRRRPRMIAR